MAAEHRIVTEKFTQYAIKWRISLTHPQFEQMWSTLMDNQIDCFVNRYYIDEDYDWKLADAQRSIDIYFKSATARTMAQSLITITK